MNTSYYFNAPAVDFEDACLVGNGKNGATVYGGTDIERILLNNDTVYSGHPRTDEEKVPRDLYKKWYAARERMLAGDLKECRRILTMEFNQGSSHKYLPVGNVYIDFGHGAVDNYRRTLDFESGVVAVEYDANGAHYRRECFAPYKENCVSFNVTCSKSASVSFKMRFETPLKPLGAEQLGASVVFRGMCPYDHDRVTKSKEPIYFYPDTEGESVSFATLIRPVIKGGELRIEDGTITVTDADEATLYIFTETSYIDPYTKPTADYVGAVTRLADACSYDYGSIKRVHTRDFSSLFSRVSFELGTDVDLPVPERIKNFDGKDVGLYALLYNFGRYLMISASRPGSRAMNLQGIWNKSTNPPWESTYTTNINLQMAYWPTFTAGLGELFEPLVSYIESTLPLGRDTAKRMYGARGFVLHSNSDIWAHAYPCGGGSLISEMWSPWPLCSGWLCEQLYDGYEYTLDEEYLKRVYPLMKEASLFYLDLLVEDTDGALILTPCSSPENRYHLGDDTFAIAKYTAIGQSIVAELFSHTVDAANILGKDAELASELEEKLKRLKGLEIGSDGRLLEWDAEYPEKDIHHRHTSHLFALYPGTAISVDKTPELAEAARRTLEVRGDDGTGWGLAWKINFWALLRDGNHAENLLKNQLRFVDHTEPHNYHFGGSYSNLLDAHPPFQIDGNFGTVAAINNMLVRSEIGRITLLPALPDDWQRGSISGVIAKGNVAVSLEWQGGRACSVSLKSPSTQELMLAVNGSEYSVALSENEEYFVSL